MSLIERIRNHREPPLFVAELSGNHHQDFDTAKNLVALAARNGADAIKLQTYTADSITLPSTQPEFMVQEGLWKGRSLHELYQEAATPYEWHKPLAAHAATLGIQLFSTPFDEAAVDFLEEEINPPVYKISSFEVTHIPLLRRVAQTRKPVLMSVGMAEESEIANAVNSLKTNGCPEVVLLKCVTQYPSVPEGFHLQSMGTLADRFQCEIGLSDHTLTNEVALAATALGARVIEKHFTDDRNAGGIDAAFSLEPRELKTLTREIRTVHSALGSPEIGSAKQDADQRRFRRSIYTTRPIRSGEVFSRENLKIVRPAHGLAPERWFTVIGKTASRDLPEHAPLQSGDWVE